MKKNFKKWIKITDNCFVCGVKNPYSLKLKPYVTNDNETEAEFIATKEYRGYSGMVHGGITSALLDELIVLAIIHNVRDYLATISIKVKYKAPFFIDSKVIVKGRYVGKEKHIYIGEGEIIDEKGKVLAVGRCEFMNIPDDKIKKFTQKDNICRE